MKEKITLEDFKKGNIAVIITDKACEVVFEHFSNERIPDLKIKNIKNYYFIKYLPHLKTIGFDDMGAINAYIEIDKIITVNQLEMPEEYLTAKVVCTKSINHFFIKGRVYNIKNGILDDEASIFVSMREIDSIKELNDRLCPNYQFIEYKGEAM